MERFRRELDSRPPPREGGDERVGEGERRVKRDWNEREDEKPDRVDL